MDNSSSKKANKKGWFYFFVISTTLIVAVFIFFKNLNTNNKFQQIKLLNAKFDSKFSIEKTIEQRRSKRNFSNKKLTFQQISQILWASQGITDKKNNFRAAPSAGALYPIQIYLMVNNIENLNIGIYKYDPFKHQLIKTLNEDKHQEIYKASFSQNNIKKAPAIIIICGNYKITTKKYGERSKQYVHIEVGCIAQNIYLQTKSLGLATVFIGAFEEKKIPQIINSSTNEIPFGIMPIGNV